MVSEWLKLVIKIKKFVQNLRKVHNENIKEKKYNQILSIKDRKNR